MPVREPLTIFASDRSSAIAATTAPLGLDERSSRFALLAVVLAAILVALFVARDLNWLLLPIGVVVAAFIWPVEIALGLFAIGVPFESLFVSHQNGVTLSWGLGAFAGSFLLFYGLCCDRFRTPPRAALWWGIFAIWSVNTTAWAWNRKISLSWAPTVLSLFALYLVITSLHLTNRELIRLRYLILAGGMVAVAVLLYESRASGLQGRATLSLGENLANPNEVAGSLILPFGLSLGSLFAAQRLTRIAGHMVVTAALAVGVFLTMSRGCLAALAVTLAFFLIRAKVRIRVLILIPILVVPFLLAPALFYSRLKDASTDRGTGRLDILMVGTRIVADSPVKGVGLANFGVAYNRYAGYAGVFRGYSRAPHNAFLQAWAETGVIGFALFIAAIWSQLRYARRINRGRSAQAYFAISVEAACWGLLVMAFSGSTLWSKAFWLAFMLLASVTRLKNDADGVPSMLNAPAPRAGQLRRHF